MSKRYPPFSATQIRVCRRAGVEGAQQPIRVQVGTRQISAGEQPVQQPARKDDDCEKRRAAGRRAGRQRAEAVMAGGVGCATAPAGERRFIAPQRALSPDQAAVRTGLRNLHQGVGHRVTGAVVHRAVQPDRADVRIADQLVVTGVRQSADASRAQRFALACKLIQPWSPFGSVQVRRLPATTMSHR